MSSDPYVAYLRRFFGRWLPLYDAFAWPIAAVYRRAVRRAEVPPGEWMLDLCTGTGEIARRACRQGARVVGVDFTLGMLVQAKRKCTQTTGRAHFLLADARALPFRDEAVRASVLSLALHDMPKRVRHAALVEAARVSRDRLVLADYRLSDRWLGRLWTQLIASFETPYFPGFVRDGGLQAAMVSAGLKAAASDVFLGLPFVVSTVRL